MREGEPNTMVPYARNQKKRLDGHGSTFVLMLDTAPMEVLPRASVAMPACPSWEASAFSCRKRTAACTATSFFFFPEVRVRDEELEQPAKKPSLRLLPTARGKSRSA